MQHNEIIRLGVYITSHPSSVQRGETHPLTRKDSSWLLVLSYPHTKKKLKSFLHFTSNTVKQFWLSILFQSDPMLDPSMFAELLSPVLLRPVFLSGPLKGNNTLFISLSNVLELEWHENTLAFDYAIKMLEAPLSVPEGFSRCQPVIYLFIYFPVDFAGSCSSSSPLQSLQEETHTRRSIH